MPQIFPRSANKLPALTLTGVLALVFGAVGFFWYYGSPKYTDVGYMPTQPVPYSHKLHVNDMGLDCRYCHVSVEKSGVSNVPPTQTCMNCHSLILTQSDTLLPIRESYGNNVPMQWVRVHKIPDYAYFSHSVHLRAGVGCESCHGNIAQMEEVRQDQPLSMGWCLDCHRNPGPHLRQLSEITKMGWTAPKNQNELAAVFTKARNIAPPEDCSTCHR